MDDKIKNQPQEQKVPTNPDHKQPNVPDYGDQPWQNPKYGEPPAKQEGVKEEV